jgi:predicted PurR-regulated permease PerM
VGEPKSGAGRRRPAGTGARKRPRAETDAPAAPDASDRSAAPAAPEARLPLHRRADPALLRLVLFFGGLTAVVVLFIVFDRIFFPLTLGLAIAYLFDPPVSWFEARGRSRVFGVLVLALLLVAVLVGFFLYLVPAMGEQFQHLGQRLPSYEARLEEQFRPWLERLRARYPERLDQLQEQGKKWLEANLPDLATSVGQRLKGIFGSLLQLLLFLLNLIFVPVFAFYLLVDFPKIKRAARELIPLPYRANVLERVGEVDQAVAGFVRGQLTIALILAAINSTGLMIIGVPLGLVIGIAAGLANLIPYMALVVGLAPALLLCWVEFGSWPRLIAVAALFTAAQLLEGTFLSPRILGKSVNLHPVWVLLAVIAGGSLFGFLGILIAVPVAAAIQVFVRHWLKLYKQSRIYRPERAG